MKVFRLIWICGLFIWLFGVDSWLVLFGWWGLIVLLGIWISSGLLIEKWEPDGRCLYRRNGKVGVYRRVDPEHVRKLEVECEIGPAGLDAKMARLEAEARELAIAERADRFAKGIQTVEDVKEQCIGVFGVPSSIFGPSQGQRVDRRMTDQGVCVDDRMDG